MLNALRQSEENHIVGRVPLAELTPVLNALRQSEENHLEEKPSNQNLLTDVLNALRQSEENHVVVPWEVYRSILGAQRLTAIRGKSRPQMLVP